MSREEIMKVLQIAIAAYPNTKNIDAKAMVAAWEMAFGEEPAERVYKAVRYHIETQRFFPTIAEIRKAMPRAEIVYMASESPAKRLQAKGDQIALPAKRSITQSEYEAILAWVEEGCPNDIDY